MLHHKLMFFSCSIFVISCAPIRGHDLNASQPMALSSVPISLDPLILSCPAVSLSIDNGTAKMVNLTLFEDIVTKKSSLRIDAIGTTVTRGTEIELIPPSVVLNAPHLDNRSVKLVINNALFNSPKSEDMSLTHEYSEFVAGVRDKRKIEVSYKENSVISASFDFTFTSFNGKIDLGDGKFASKIQAKGKTCDRSLLFKKFAITCIDKASASPSIVTTVSIATNQVAMHRLSAGSSPRDEIQIFPSPFSGRASDKFDSNIAWHVEDFGGVSEVPGGPPIGKQVFWFTADFHNRETSNASGANFNQFVSRKDYNSLFDAPVPLKFNASGSATTPGVSPSNPIFKDLKDHYPVRGTCTISKI